MFRSMANPRGAGASCGSVHVGGRRWNAGWRETVGGVLAACLGGIAGVAAAADDPAPLAIPSLAESLDGFAADLERVETDLEEIGRLQERLERLSQRIASLEASLLVADDARRAAATDAVPLPRPPATVLAPPNERLGRLPVATVPPLPERGPAAIIVPPADVITGEFDRFPRLDDIPADSQPLPQVDVVPHGCLRRWLRAGTTGRWVR